MRLVVADTSPIRYLLQIEQIELLPRLFIKVFLPSVVAAELRHPSAPAVVSGWMQAPPTWLEIMPAPPSNDPGLQALDDGEKAALALGLALHADLLLIDDRKAAAVAAQKGFAVAGTLGVLDLAAQRGLVDIAETIGRLRATNFRCREELFDLLLAQHAKGGEG